MKDKRIKNFEEIEVFERKLKSLKSLYQNPMVFTDELAKSNRNEIDDLRDSFNDILGKAYTYIDDYTINYTSYRGKMLELAREIANKSFSGECEDSLKLLDEHNTVISYLDDLTKERKEWLETKYIEYMQRPIDLDSNSVALVGYKLVNAYGDDLNNPAYVKLVKRIYKQLMHLVKKEDIRTFYVIMNKGVSICNLLALYHVKKTLGDNDDIKVICVEEFENISRTYPREIRGLYKQAMSIANRFIYIEEEMNIRPFGVLNKEKTNAMMEWVASKTSRTVAVYTLGSKEMDVENYLEKAKEHKHVINYVEV